MTWTKVKATSAGHAYFSTSCIVWRQDKAPLCKYIIQRVLHGKGFRWLLWQWNDAEGVYIQDDQVMIRLRDTQERAGWWERRDARAGIRRDHSSPIEAAAAEFAATLEQGEE